MAALTSASLLDVTEDGVLEIHDWSEYTGKLIEQRENEKNRSRARRAAAKSNDRRTTAGQSEDASKSDQKKTAGRVDQTRVDQSRPENKGIPHNPHGREAAKRSGTTFRRVLGCIPEESRQESSTEGMGKGKARR